MSSKVLIVDDSMVMRKIVVKSLRAAGFDIEPIEAADGKDALKKVNAKVQLIITDWNMPHMDGLSFAKKIKGDKNTKHIPIIMLTTEGSMAKFEEAVECGINDYVSKPFTPEKLKRKLDKFIN